MMKLLEFAVVLMFAFYTVLYGFEVKKEPNLLGFFAILTLAFIATAVPFYVLFLKD